MVMRYWVSCIIQDKKDSVPWMSTCSTCQLSLEEALMVVNDYKNNFRVLSVWIDQYDDDNNKTVAYHECCIDNFENPKEKLVRIHVSCWKYNNDQFEITDRSVKAFAIIKGDTIEDAFKYYQERKMHHDLSKYSQLQIDDIRVN